TPGRQGFRRFRPRLLQRLGSAPNSQLPREFHAIAHSPGERRRPRSHPDVHQPVRRLRKLQLRNHSHQPPLHCTLGLCRGSVSGPQPWSADLDPDSSKMLRTELRRPEGRPRSEREPQSISAGSRLRELKTDHSATTRPSSLTLCWLVAPWMPATIFPWPETDLGNPPRESPSHSDT